jgi:hypothetical protein
MQIDRVLEIEIATKTSLMRPLPMAAHLARTSNSVWSRPKGNSFMVNLLTAASCALACYIVELSLTSAFFA